MTDFNDNATRAFLFFVENRDDYSKEGVARLFNTSACSINRRMDNRIATLIDDGETLDTIMALTDEPIARILRVKDDYDLYLCENDESTDEIVDDSYGESIDDLYEDEEDEEEIFFNITNSGITMVMGEHVTTVNKTDSRYSQIRDLLIDGYLDDAMELADIPLTIEKFSEGSITVENNRVMYKGVEVHNTMAERLVNMLAEGTEGVTRFARFFESLMAVPDKRIVEELYPFLQHMNIEINADGSFFAYKAVRSNYTDMHSGQFDNSVGAVPEMPRHMVDDNKEQTCSAGLHFAALGYARMFGGSGRGDHRLMKVKVFPADVVSVPVDYNGQKGRACKYEIVEDITDTVGWE